jgi:hypothetical protein
VEAAPVAGMGFLVAEWKAALDEYFAAREQEWRIEEATVVHLAELATAIDRRTQAELELIRLRTKHESLLAEQQEDLLNVEIQAIEQFSAAFDARFKSLDQVRAEFLRIERGVMKR